MRATTKHLYLQLCEFDFVAWAFPTTLSVVLNVDIYYFCNNALCSLCILIDCWVLPSEVNRSVRDIVHGVRSGMASVRLQPPSPFDFKTPDEWPRWKRRFEQFRLASGLASESDDRQVSTLLYCMGEEAEDILASTNIAKADRWKYSAVIKQYDNFFQVQKKSSSRGQDLIVAAKQWAIQWSSSPACIP